MKEDFAKYLESFVTPNRAAKINENLNNRTRYLTVVLENVFQSHNVSAILRTCDCFGIQDIHVIENNNIYKTNPEIALGSDQWLTIHNYNKTNNNTALAVKNLKSKGYRIVATSSHAENDNMDKLDLSAGKIAFVFGTELSGISSGVE
jgi:tRNA (guanosine-2'-O-)-methyltransferase